MCIGSRSFVSCISVFYELGHSVTAPEMLQSVVIQHEERSSNDVSVSAYRHKKFLNLSSTSRATGVCRIVRVLALVRANQLQEQAMWNGMVKRSYASVCHDLNYA